MELCHLVLTQLKKKRGEEFVLHPDVNFLSLLLYQICAEILVSCTTARVSVLSEPYQAVTAPSLRPLFLTASLAPVEAAFNALLWGAQFLVLILTPDFAYM